MSYDIVSYQPGLRAGIVALMRDLVPGDDALRSAYFRWKHEENPSSAAPIVYVALADGRPVGMRAFMPARFRVPGTPGSEILLCACDLVIARAHRRRGLHGQIMDVACTDLARQGHRILLSFSANPTTYHASLRMGWQVAVPYAARARQTRAFRFADRARARLAQMPAVWRFSALPRRLVVTRGFDALDARWRARGAGDVALARDPRPREMAALAAAIDTRRGAPDAAHYNWRFRNPLAEYRFVYHGGPTLGAFLVLQRSRHQPGADLAIVDYGGADRNALAMLIDEVVATGGYDRIVLWTMTLPRAMVDRLDAAGFGAFDLSRGAPAYRPGLLVRDLCGRMPSEPATDTSAGAWDLRMLDSDAY